MMRRTLLAAVGAMALTFPALAQNKVTRIVVAFAPGGPVDTVGRILAEQLTKDLGRQVIVDNKPGANGAIGAQDVLRSAPDGNTMWITSVGAVAINPALYPDLPYNMTKDFAPVSIVVNNVEILVVNPKNPAKSPKDFIANAKANPDTSVASSGIGSIPHLAMEQLGDATGAKFMHVPFKGAAPAIAEVLGGHVSGFFGDVPGLISYIKSGRLTPIAVASAKRHPALPDIPTFEEHGFKGIDTNNWYALFVSAKTAPDVVASLNKSVRTALMNPEVNAKLTSLGADPAPSTPEELAAILKGDTDKWGILIKAKQIKAE
ncbi:MAG: tripartite tricarboxylate transporter substrate binding protein [Proteobacteria bacterium]|nr:tripartite tricarboxylate transporter substrate binding protein [Pseudomonadota bacterium]